MSLVQAAPPVTGRGKALGRLTLTELKLLCRDRIRIAITIALPLMLLAIFGSIPFYHQKRANLGGHSLFQTYVPILIAYALVTLSLTSLPLMLASYREKGILRRMRTTPAGPVLVLAAQLISYLVISVATVIVILTVARLGYNVHVPRQIGGFILAAVLATASLMAVGLFIAAAAPSARTAQAIGQVLFFPMMFSAGLFFPVPVMPKILQHISHATPLGAGVQALSNAWTGTFPHTNDLLTMAAYAAGFGLAAAVMFRWE